MAETDPERQASSARRVHGQALLSDCHRMTWIGRNNRGPQLDSWYLTSDDGENGQRVVAEDVRRPVRREPVRLHLPSFIDNVVYCAVVNRSTKDPNAHAVTVVLESLWLAIRTPYRSQLIETSSSQDSEK